MSLSMCIFTRFYLLITNLKKIKAMTRDEVKELLPVITAFAEGKPIEFFTITGKWVDYNLAEFNPNLKYRIKQDTEYRPFSSIGECWEEMKKHEPFAWLKDKNSGDLIVITALRNEGIDINRSSGWDFKGLNQCYTFADGNPFGIEQL